MANHSGLEKLIDCPTIYASTIAIEPERKNLTDNSKNGGASSIQILADVNALDQINAKDTPSIKSRIFIDINNVKKRLPER